jgi:hypothetical protein
MGLYMALKTAGAGNSGADAAFIRHFRANLNTAFMGFPVPLMAFPP